MSFGYITRLNTAQDETGFLLSDMPRNRTRMSVIVTVWDLKLSWWWLQQTCRFFSNMGPS